MKYQLRIEDSVISLNDLFKEKFPNSKGNYVIKKEIKPQMFGAIKLFSLELFYVDATIKCTKSIMICSIGERAISDSEEDKAWNRLGVLFNTELFKYILAYEWEEDYDTSK